MATPPARARKPKCPKETTGDTPHKVLVHAGHRDPRFAKYHCTTCQYVWEQKRPEHLAPDEDPVITERSVAGVNGASRTTSGGYLCGRCGQIKRGHTCPFVQNACRKRKRNFIPKTHPLRAIVSEIDSLDEEDHTALLELLERHDLRLSDVKRLRTMSEKPVATKAETAKTLCALSNLAPVESALSA